MSQQLLPTPRVRQRDPHRTRETILAAAICEFSRKGLAGARVDVIARRAGVNKRMLYHYFGNKDELFSAVLKQKIAKRESLLASAPDNPLEALAYWFEAGCRDPDWYRLVAWEALERSDHPVIEEEHRLEVFLRAIQQTKRRQRKGLLPPHLDPRHLLLSMMAITAFPLAFPQITRLVTGKSIENARFQRDRRNFLRKFAALFSTEGKQVRA